MTGCVHASLNLDNITYKTTTSSKVPLRVDGLESRHKRLFGPDGQLRVLVVNGMATHAHGYSFDVQNKIASQLGSSQCMADRLIELDTPAFEVGKAIGERFDLPPATLRITHWGDETDGTPRLVFYETLWTPYADAFANRFLAPYESDVELGLRSSPDHCGGEKDAPPVKQLTDDEPNFPSRSLLNGIIKDDVMLDGLADAVLSVGPLGAAARDAIRQSICIMASDALEVPARSDIFPRCELTQATMDRFGGTDRIVTHLDQHEFAVLTYSLGSFLLLDTLDEFRLWPGDLGAAEPTCALMPSLLDDTPVYMFSNQVALLLAAHPHFGCDPETSCNLYAEFGDHKVLLTDPREHRGAAISASQSCDAQTSLRLIAFNDPNDVMGYRLPDFLIDSPLIGSILNIEVRNPAFQIPFLLTDPAAAHSNHDRNPKILDFMIKGWVAEMSGSDAASN